MNQVKVRALEWRELSDAETADTYGCRFIAHCSFGGYFVNSSAYGKAGWSYSRLGYAHIECADADAAKAAAQADYEARILSALEPPELQTSPHDLLGEAVAWCCAKCDCHSFARVDERQMNGSFAPGDKVRCVNCKDVSFYPKPVGSAIESGGTEPYVPALIRNESEGFVEFVTQDVATITGEVFAANVEPIVRMGAPRGEVLGYRIYDATPTVSETVTVASGVREAHEFTAEQIADLYGGEIADRWKINDSREAVKLIVQQAIEHDRRHSLASPVTDGVREARERQFKLWFFRDLSADQRAKLYGIAGLPTDEIQSHAHERLALDLILKDLSASQPASEGKVGLDEVVAILREHEAEARRDNEDEIAQALHEAAKDIRALASHAVKER